MKVDRVYVADLNYEIAEKELPQEQLFQDGELNRKQAKDNLKRLFKEGRVSSITYNYYINSYDWGD
tara:strand:- start:230 stop:427 length:198 start_codon:yes stop_codon:yes gene_type:complete